MDILDQAKKSMEAKKYEYPTGTLNMTFQKPAGEANLYVQFLYGPQTIFNHTLGKVSVSIKVDSINANKQVKNQRHKDDN